MGSVIESDRFPLKPGMKSGTMDRKDIERLYPELEQLERDLTASLYSLWRLLGKRKKVIRLDK